MGGDAPNALYQRAGLQMCVQDLGGVGLGRIGMHHNRAEFRRAVLAERQRADPPRFIHGVDRPVALPGRLDMHHGVNVQRHGVGRVVTRQVRGEHVARIADEVPARPRKHSDQHREQQWHTSRDLRGPRRHSWRGERIPLVDVCIDDRNRVVCHDVSVRVWRQ